MQSSRENSKMVYSVFWTPKGFNELPEVHFGFYFTFTGYCQSRNQSLHVLKVWYTEQGNAALLRRRSLPRLTYVCNAGKLECEIEDSIIFPFPRGQRPYLSKKQSMNDTRAAKFTSGIWLSTQSVDGWMLSHIMSPRLRSWRPKNEDISNYLTYT